MNLSSCLMPLAPDVAASGPGGPQAGADHVTGLRLKLGQRGGFVHFPGTENTCRVISHTHKKHLGNVYPVVGCHTKEKSPRPAKQWLQEHGKGSKGKVNRSYLQKRSSPMCREDTRWLQPMFFLQRAVAERSCSVPLSQSKLLLISHVPAQLPPQAGSLHQHPKVDDQGLCEREREPLPFLPFILVF